MPCFDQRRCAERAQVLSLSSLLCLGLHTLTGLLTTSGQQFEDWSAAYRLFSRQRLPVASLFSSVRRAVLTELPADEPLCVVVDDTLLRRSGNKTPGVAWRRDPLGPRFQTNFVRAQRFVQFSAALPTHDGITRMVPISFLHSPTPPKPSAKATTEQLAQHRKQARDSRLSVRAARHIAELRQTLDQDEPASQRTLIVAFDGGYANSTVLKSIPPNTIFIGRIRKDAALCFTPDLAMRKARGRCLRYGNPAPTPEQIRTDDSCPWESLTVTQSGASHQLRYKHCTNLMWRTAGADRVLQLIVIAPLGYRLRKGSKMLYRQPGFLICTDAMLDVQRIIQSYLQRWDIEVNFRDEKTLLGVGQAQVRNESSVESAPALTVASYSMLLIAAHRAFSNCTDGILPRPKWSARNAGPRISTQQLIHQLRADVWGRGLGIRNFSGFASSPAHVTKPEKCSFPIASAVCYANG